MANCEFCDRPLDKHDHRVCPTEAKAVDEWLGLYGIDDLKHVKGTRGRARYRRNLIRVRVDGANKKAQGASN